MNLSVYVVTLEICFRLDLFYLQSYGKILKSVCENSLNGQLEKMLSDVNPKVASRLKSGFVIYVVERCIGGILFDC